MQSLTHPHPTPPRGRCSPAARSRRALLPYAALVVFGAALGGCGVEPAEVADNTKPVQTLDSPKCTSETQGGPTSCKDEATWSAYGAMTCAGKGLVLNHISFGTSCGSGKYREATYDCCTAPSPPPGPTPRMCMWSPATGTGACLAADAWKKEGTAFCSAHRLQLNDVKLDRPCGMGGYGSAQFECCTPTPPPPPPPPTMCTTEALSDRSCVDDGTWKTRADAACKAKKLNLASLAFGAACMGGHLEVKFECCGPTPPPPPPPPPPMCTGEALRDVKCVDDGTWKTRAETACKAKMQTLGALGFGTACPGGHLDVKFECCGPTPPPPPPPPPPMCSTEVLAERSCVDDGTWKTRADAACRAKMQTLTALGFGTACPGGHLDVKFECCGPTPPPPPPMCTAEALRDMRCVDDATWKTRADAECKAKKLTLVSLAFGAACAGGHQEIKFECCASPPPPPPPPPPPMCTTEALAEMRCVDDGTWKTRADAVCKAKKQTLTTLAFGAACAGGHLEVRFQCCGPTPPPPPVCSTDKAPGSGMCRTPAQWKTEGDTFCAAKKQILTGLSMSGPCMGGFNDAEFECCDGASPPPPPPPTCSGGVLGDGRTCAAEATLKSQAEGVCKMAGLRLTAFSPYDACGPMGQYLHAKYECCK